MTGLLIPLPFLLASAAYSSSTDTNAAFPPLSAYSPDVFAQTDALPLGSGQHGTSLVQACTLTSGTLLLVGLLAQIRSNERVLDRRKSMQRSLTTQVKELISVRGMQKMAQNTLSLGLPFYASMQLGGMRVGLVILAAVASGLICVDKINRGQSVAARALASHQAVCVAILLCLVADFSGFTMSVDASSLGLGYLALLCSLFLLPPPLPIGLSASTLTASANDSMCTLAAGLVSFVMTIGASIILSSAPPITLPAIALSTMSMASCAALFMSSQPSALRTGPKLGLALGCLVAAASSFLFSPTIWPGTVVNGALSALSFLGVLYDTSLPLASHDHHDHDHAHTGHSHHKHNHGVHAHTKGQVSILTAFFLKYSEPGSLLNGILVEKDSRRIAYFTCLNFGFMLVQAFYGWVSGSLGLLSDTVHMFFDCLALVVGLGAAVASKWPTSPEKPYGWGKLNTLAGFGNGIFLMLVSVEFAWEAIEGIMEGRELRRVQELLIVSTLGFLVNMVGLLAFGHAHAGHDHGHGHSNDDHSHSHAHSHAHSHDHSHSHAHDHSHSHSHSPANGGLTPLDHTPPKAAHSHANENMHGIYLHIAADAGGSLAVIISTALNLYAPWYLWDPLATIIIAILIFMAAVPLVKESGRKLLLVIPDELEWNLKTALQELVTLRGVTGYAVPRFWVEDRGEGGDPHGHAGHSHAGHEAEHKEVRILGVIHVFAARVASTEDVRERVVQFFSERNMDVVVQVEREGEGRCWCGGGIKVG